MDSRFKIPAPLPGIGALLVILPLVALVVAIMRCQGAGR
jgi:hypothetical protein